jgi:hypothetical protein
MKMEQSVPKCWHIKFRCQGITQKKAYKIKNENVSNFKKLRGNILSLVYMAEVQVKSWSGHQLP